MVGPIRKEINAWAFILGNAVLLHWYEYDYYSNRCEFDYYYIRYEFIALGTCEDEACILQYECCCLPLASMLYDKMDIKGGCM